MKNSNENIKDLITEVNTYAGTERGSNAKIRYEITKLEEERKRNYYLFLISMALFLIAITNLVIATLKYLKCG